MTKKTKILMILSIAGIVFLGGCEILNLGEILITPTYGEQKIPAEYDLKDNSKDGIMVYVEGNLGSGSNLSLEDNLSMVIKGYMVQNAKIKDQYIQSLSPKSMTRQQGSSLRGLSPVQIAKKFNRSMVLHVVIENNQLYQMSDRGYYDGTIITRSRLYDSETGKVLWPQEKGGRIIKTQVELEVTGRDATSERLQSATGHCIVRSFYDCIRNKYRIKDEVENLMDEKYW